MQYYYQNAFISLLACNRNKNEISFTKQEIYENCIYKSQGKLLRKFTAIPKAIYTSCIKTSCDLFKIIFIGIPKSVVNPFKLKAYTFIFLRHYQTSLGYIISIFNDRVGKKFIEASKNHITYYKKCLKVNSNLENSIKTKIKSDFNVTKKNLSELVFKENLNYPSKAAQKSHVLQWLDKTYDLRGEKVKNHLSIELKWQLYYIALLCKDKDGIVNRYKIDFSKLNSSEVVSLYNILNNYVVNNSNSEVLKRVIFDIEDYFFRLCIEPNASSKEANVNAKDILTAFQALNTETLKPIIEKLTDVLGSDNHSSFHTLVSQAEGNDLETLKKSTIKLHPLHQADSNEKRPVKVLKLATENSRNKIGGIASVLVDSAAAHKSMGMEKIYGFHPFYDHDKGVFDVKFVGVITHQYQGQMVQSSIYKDKEKNEFLVQPDPRYRSLLDIGCSKNVYKNFKSTNREERNIYLSSASASFIGLYAGKGGNKHIDVVEAEAYFLGSLGFELLESRIEPMLKEVNLPLPKRIYLSHSLMGGGDWQGTCSTQKLQEIGGDLKSDSKKINLTKIGLTLSHRNVFVSKGVKKDALSKKWDLNMGLRDATLANGGVKKVKAITNGIDTGKYDPTNKQQFGNLALQRTFLEGGIESTDFIGNQKKLKNLLFEKGIIPDRDKPLFLYVGRYSSEKGIDMLPAMVEEIEKQGAQCVIMGIRCQSFLADRTINRLMKLAKKKPGLLRVYDDIKDQITPLLNEPNQVNAWKGNLIRAAASVVMVPSHSEACGLVPMEAHCTGALVIAPYHQGLRDMCMPLNWQKKTKNKPLTLLDGANAVCYKNDRSKLQAKQAVRTAINAIKTLTEEQLNQFMIQTRNKAQQKYGWVIKDEDNRIVGGAALKYSKLYHDLCHANKDRPFVETFDEAMNRVTQKNKLIEAK